MDSTSFYARAECRDSPTLLFVVNVAWFFVSHRLPLARAAIGAGYRVHVATAITSEQDRAAIKSAGIELHEVSFARSGISVIRELRTVTALRALFRRVRPTIVHLVTVKPVIYGGLVARWCRVPAVVSAIPGLGYSFSSNGLRQRLMRGLLLPMYRVALANRKGRVIFQNEENRNYFISRGIVTSEQTELIRGSGVDTRQFVPRSPTGQGPVRVVLAARMLWEKGVAEFVEAARALRKAGANAQFVLVGGPDPMNPGSIDAAQLQSWHRAGDVEWAGFQRDMVEVLASSHIVCLPTYYGEGLPKILLEAAASGRPIVTTDVPGCRDIARRGVNALLVAPRDPAALAAALRILIESAEMREQFGRAGRELAESQFDLDRVIRQTLSIYRAMTQR